MFQKLPFLLNRFPRVAVVTVALIAVLALVACSGSSESDLPTEDTSDGLALVWEAWEQINLSYASPEALNAETVVSGAMARVLDLVDITPYPFLTEIGRMRGQPPAHVPGEMVDLWRAVAKHQAANPDFEPSTVAEAAVGGMLAGLGDNSAVFLNSTQYPLAKESLEGGIEGTYLGIGARVVSQDGQVVLFPFAGSPAESAGVLPGDVLSSVAGVSVLGQGVEEVVDQVSGPKGTKVTLEVLRVGEPEPVSLEVFRGDIELQSVASQLIPGGIGYVRISRFRDNTGEQVFTALENLNRFDLLALVLDIRTNPGGSSAAAKETAGEFLPDGSVFGYVEDRNGERVGLTIDPNEDRLNLDDLLVAVLVNEQTSHEAETLAAALQDSGRATLFGTTTFGDASAYEFVELSDGSAMYLPVSRRYTPLGRLLARSGVTPDVEVLSVAEEEGYGGESQFNRAYEFLDEQLPPFR
ncbi:MAG: PDZ domain-containing protein [SAR202 cluster bacterium]|jgi:carboxyl-terminal processing protease|nr:PDZ domain-containing protein [SAR202 cluster bacterium]|tara:strand:- start:1498 stop:2901 length:1404 start_codon:yes stop_codon:yes gene_type:complete